MICAAFLCLSFGIMAQEDHSIARTWNEEVLNAIRNDFARPTVHARNLWHTSVAMYDIWAIHDSIAQPFFMGNTVDGFTFEFEGIPESDDPEADIHEAISFAMYRLIFNRFIRSPGAGSIISNITLLMIQEGYNVNNTSLDYQSGDPAALGNYVADRIIAFGLQDNSNQEDDYENRFYEPVNDPLVIFEPGAGDIVDLNRWQPLTLEVFIDQSGNVVPGSTPDFLSPEWGIVSSFALEPEDLTVYNRDGFDYHVYHDPGDPPYISETELTPDSDEYKWGFALVSVWASHLDPADGVMWDISPGNIGNVPFLPDEFPEFRDYYDFFEGGDPSLGHDINPATGAPYPPNMVPRADYARVLAEFWADGPDSETPPGHWFTILNYVNDHPMFERKYRGQGDALSELEWDVKAYMLLGGAMHDCAISAWGVKGYYDYIRPVSAIRGMADKGQSSDPNLPNYHPAGIPLYEGYIELVEEGDPLAGNFGQNVNKIKLYTWRGPEFIDDPETDVAGVGWILAENWWPYQRPSFVTPPFAGYVSGHSTYSRAASEVLTVITGDEYFPGGVGEFIAEQNEFLVFEDGPSTDVVLQWATYRDASDQTSLSRIWGGIHPPADDIPGRKIGIEVAEDAVAKAESFFFVDRDNDGFYNYEDCDDFDAMINPGMPETCDGIDNNCSGEIDEGLTIFRYYFDADNDGFGEAESILDTCLVVAPAGFTDNPNDCDDMDAMINPDSPEVCDNIDNNCSGEINEGLTIFRYYLDVDNDGYGDAAVSIDSCTTIPPQGFVDNDFDCVDTDASINPVAQEICDGIDNNCTGGIDEGLPLNRYYQDFDNDGFGNESVFIDTCLGIAPEGFVLDFTDCNDDEASINPLAPEIADNGIDEDCSGIDLFQTSKVFPNPFDHSIRVQLDFSGAIEFYLYNTSGYLVYSGSENPSFNFFEIDLSSLSSGVYYFRIVDQEDNELYADTIIKL